MQYMIMPIELNEDEQNIFTLLYRASNYSTMQSEYTIEQLVQNSSKKLNLNSRKVNTIIKKLILKKYITRVKKGCRGVPSIFKINTIEIARKEKEKSNKKKYQNYKKNDTKEENRPSQNAYKAFEFD